VVLPALNVNIPRNDTTNEDNELDYKWDSDSSVQVVAQETASGKLADAMQAAVAGDIVQYATSSIQHTIIVGAVTENGIWVFDSNYNEDLTPQYHFISNESLGRIEKFTHYRISQ
jgi:hypothetical protein